MSSWDPTKIKTKIKKASSSSPSSSSSSSTLQDGSEDENELGNLKVREELNSTVKNSDPLYDKVRVDGYNLLHEKDVYASRSIIMCVLDTDVWSHVCECMYVPPHLQLAQRLLTLQNQGGLKMAMNDKYENVEVRHQLLTYVALSPACSLWFSPGLYRVSMKNQWCADAPLVRICSFGVCVCVSVCLFPANTQFAQWSMAIEHYIEYLSGMYVVHHSLEKFIERLHESFPSSTLTKCMDALSCNGMLFRSSALLEDINALLRLLDANAVGDHNDRDASMSGFVFEDIGERLRSHDIVEGNDDCGDVNRDGHSTGAESYASTESTKTTEKNKKKSRRARKRASVDERREQHVEGLRVDTMALRHSEYISTLGRLIRDACHLDLLAPSLQETSLPSIHGKKDGDAHTDGGPLSKEKSSCFKMLAMTYCLYLTHLTSGSMVYERMRASLSQRYENVSASVGSEFFRFYTEYADAQSSSSSPTHTLSRADVFASFRANVNDIEDLLEEESYELLSQVGNAMQRTALLLAPLARK